MIQQSPRGGLASPVSLLIDHGPIIDSFKCRLNQITSAALDRSTQMFWAHDSKGKFIEFTPSKIDNSMPHITRALLRRRAEHNEGQLSTLEELTLHQEELEGINEVGGECMHAHAQTTVRRDPVNRSSPPPNPDPTRCWAPRAAGSRSCTYRTT